MTNFLCPHCREHLRVSESIVFLTKTKKGKSCLLFVNNEVGNYSVKMHPAYNHFVHGEIVDFICPICYKNLDAEEYTENLAKVISQTDDGKESTIVFSKIYGEKCTYQIIDGNLMAFGKDSAQYKSALSFLLILPELNTSK